MPQLGSSRALNSLRRLCSGAAFLATIAFPALACAQSGRLEHLGHAICGATFVGDRHVVTAAHCLFDRQTGTRLPISDLSVVLRSESARIDLNVESVQITSDFMMRARLSRDAISRDRAILRLARAPEMRAALIRPTEILRRPLFLRIGGPGGQACPVDADYGDILALDCVLDPGTSGEGVFLIEDNTARLVAVISATIAGGRKTAAAPLRPILGHDDRRLWTSAGLRLTSRAYASGLSF